MDSQLMRKYLNILQESIDSIAEVAPPGEKAERMVKHIKAGYAKDGKLTDKEKAIAYATAWKAKKAGRVEEQLDEKWDVETKVSPKERGKYKGKSKAELLKQYNALKKRGPHSRGSKEYGTMRELAFAIRAKGGWGKVGEE